MSDVRLTLSRSTGFTLDVDFDVPATGVTVFFGPSGCGKTTILRSIAGLEHAHGKVSVAGHLWQDDEKRIFVPTYRRRIGYVFQEASLFDHLSVRRNLEYGLSRIKDEAGMARLMDAVDLLGIGHLLDRRTNELSGGERQRCAIARSLAIKPTALLMDEPLAALDHARRLEIMPWLEKLRHELEIPILLVTHSEEEVLHLADQMVVLENGKITQLGDVARVWGIISPTLGAEEGATSLVLGTVAAEDPAWNLVRIDSGDASIWTQKTGEIKVGERVRLQIHANDVSLALEKPSKTTIQNVFKARIVGLRDTDSASSQILVVIDAGAGEILSLVTRRSVDEMGLTPGREVWAQVKSVAVRLSAQ